jgi:hypothetical protein
MRRHISGREATYMAIESDKRGPVKIEPLPEGLLPTSSSRGAGLALAEWLCRTADRVDPARVSGSFHRLQRGAFTPHSANLCLLLQ